MYKLLHQFCSSSKTHKVQQPPNWLLTSASTEGLTELKSASNSESPLVAHHNRNLFAPTSETALVSFDPATFLIPAADKDAALEFAKGSQPNELRSPTLAPAARWRESVAMEWNGNTLNFNNAAYNCIQNSADLSTHTMYLETKQKLHNWSIRIIKSLTDGTRNLQELCDDYLMCSYSWCWFSGMRVSDRCPLKRVWETKLGVENEREDKTNGVHLFVIHIPVDFHPLRSCKLTLCSTWEWRYHLISECCLRATTLVFMTFFLSFFFPFRMSYFSLLRAAHTSQTSRGEAFRPMKMHKCPKFVLSAFTLEAEVQRTSPPKESRWQQF